MGRPRIHPLVELPYRKPRPVSFNADLVLTQINDVVTKVVDAAARSAFMVATHKVPVRKVFRGGRSHSRPMTMRELRSSQRAFMASLSTAQVTQHRLMTAAGVTSPYSVEGRRGTRITTSRDRANLWNDTKEARQVVFDIRTSPPSARLLNTNYERYLRSWAIYELRAANNPNVRPRFAVWKPLDTENDIYYLGGNLRNSIRIEDGSMRRKSGSLYKVSNVVQAGGPRAPYAQYVEFGTRHAPAQPFLRPALKHVEVSYGFATKMETNLRQRFGV